MSQHRCLVTTLARRRLRSEYHAARLGGSLAALVGAQRAAVLASLPDKPQGYFVATREAAPVRRAG